MRPFRILMLVFGAFALCAGMAEAGLNPANPGLAVSNGSSAMCINCHTAAPGGNTHWGSHFIFNPADSPARPTNSGGGNIAGGLNAARTAGQYFKTTQWTGSTGSTSYSKYGRSADNASVSAANDNATYGGAVFLAASNASYQGYQVICESCHNVVRNVAGGNNLVAPMTAMTAAQQTQVAPWNATNEATLCVGCHGFMYTTDAANAGTTNYADARNTSEWGGGKGNNHFHRINGAQFNQNHHVMSGDTIAAAQATAGILWRDVNSLPSDGAAAALDVTSARGQMPQRAAWLNTDGSGKVKAGAANFNCVTCHSQPHSGNNETAASILRDADAGGVVIADTRPAAVQHTYRIGEGAGGNQRAWMGFSDVQYCNDCHTLATK